MQKFLHENFCVIETLAGLLPISAILANCFFDMRRANKSSQDLAKAIEISHRLTAEGMDRDDVKRKINKMRGLMKNGK